ncbi:metalloendoprotein 1 [Dorcoceras hygrometricum]|uniref:Metalloendoprotein 1 n=1 Tax=Dorcoceras hygrometricum TaxID=472368 RepID=A0A2Z7APZ2_9LAMI|nr:metalloendoprotein 1 [Dorcoceras hygrometricum]
MLGRSSRYDSREGLKASARPPELHAYSLVVLALDDVGSADGEVLGPRVPSGELRRGDKAELVHKLKKHLIYLGYLGTDNLGIENNFDRHLKHAIEKYQEFYGLNVTGIVDMNTITSLRKPRCGFPDFLNPQAHSKSLYSFYPGNPKWTKTQLRYYIVPTTPDPCIPPIEEALYEWQRVTPFRFPIAGNSFPDIKFSFQCGQHGECAEAFYPESRSIAHASPPPDGKIHFNAYMRWSTAGDADAFDIKTTAMHDIGHALGLMHSAVEDSIMFSQLAPGVTRNIHADDIEGIRVLYEF